MEERPRAVKGLLLEFIFLTVIADLIVFGMVWPFIKSKIRKESRYVHDLDHDNAQFTRKHVITHWNDHGSGRGDDADGWRCSCGLFRMGSRGIQEHLDFVKDIERANIELADE